MRRINWVNIHRIKWVTPNRIYWINAIGFCNEQGQHEFLGSDSKWHWISLTHGALTVNGVWAGGTITASTNTANDSVYDQYAGMALDYHIVWSTTCAGKPCTRAKDDNSSIVIEVNQVVND